MKGVVFNILDSLIVEKFGDEMMETIYDEVVFTSDAPPFIGPETYPDSDLLQIVALLSEKTGIPATDLVFAFGRFMFPVLANEFPVFFEGITSPLEFLETVDGIIHVEVKKLFAQAAPPSIRIDRVDAEHAVVHYRSERKLCRLMEGLLEGVAAHFGTGISYSHRQCMLDGADECILDIQFGRSSTP